MKFSASNFGVLFFFLGVYIGLDVFYGQDLIHLFLKCNITYNVSNLICKVVSITFTSLGIMLMLINRNSLDRN